MAGNLRIFLNSTCDDLFQERRDLADALIAQGHSVIVSESGRRFPVSPFLSCVDNCLEAISEHTDLVVLVVAARYGSLATDHMSVTEAEFTRARSLGIPVYAFVRQKIWDLRSIWLRHPHSDLSPVVDDNRIFNFIDHVAAFNRGSWVFPFRDASDIIETLKFQISVLIKDRLDQERLNRTGDVHYRYTNNLNILLSPSGFCRRSLEYEIFNGSSESVEAIHCADRSDVDITAEDMTLSVRASDGRVLEYDFARNSPRHKIWDIRFPKPIEPGDSFRYVASWFSFDLGEMETGHTRRGASGFIQCLFTPGSIGELQSVEIRTNKGWIADPPGAAIIRDPRLTSVSLFYRDIGGYWRFRTRWSAPS